MLLVTPCRFPHSRENKIRFYCRTCVRARAHRQKTHTATRICKELTSAERRGRRVHHSETAFKIGRPVLFRSAVTLMVPGLWENGYGKRICMQRTYGRTFPRARSFHRYDLALFSPALPLSFVIPSLCRGISLHVLSRESRSFGCYPQVTPEKSRARARARARC